MPPADADFPNCLSAAGFRPGAGFRGTPVTKRRIGAAQAQLPGPPIGAGPLHEPVEIHALATLSAGDPRAFIPWHLMQRQRDSHPLLAKQFLIVKLAIGLHLLLSLALDLRIPLLSQLTRVLKRDNPQRPPRFQ